MKPKCPVCGAPFRGSVECSRCGADLAPLMRLLARGEAARSRALGALSRGEFSEALRHSESAVRTRTTLANRRLRELAGWLAANPL